jgi:FixJ family two-component response regulator
MISFQKRHFVSQDDSDATPIDRPSDLGLPKPLVEIDDGPEQFDLHTQPDPEDVQSYTINVSGAPDVQDERNAQNSLTGELGTVFLLIEKPLVFQFLRATLCSAGIRVVRVKDYSELFAEPRPDNRACVIVGRCVAGMDGKIAQEIVQASNNKMPVIFITANHDVAFAVQVMLAGAVDVLPLVPTEEELLEAVNEALSLDEKIRGKTVANTEFSERFSTLTQRERQVMTAVVGGALNKQVAYTLGLSVITIKMHRGSAMRKMGATTFADLVKIAGVLGLLDSEEDAVIEDSADIAA